MRRLALLTSLPVALLCVHPVATRATTSTLVLQPNAATTDDSFLREDKASENRGSDKALHVRTSAAGADRNNMLIRIPLSGLSGKTVLQAWLALQQSGNPKGSTIEARVFPLTESWNESVVNWTLRSQVLVLGVSWSVPGGTHGAHWTDRQFVGAGADNSVEQWSVGPIVEAWNSGALTNNGFVIEPVREGANREALFNSSDAGGGASRPALIVQYTDLPPAIASGTAEIQPRMVRSGSTNVPLTAWLSVDAVSNAPSGAATGFDALLFNHRGGLVVTRVDRFVVGGVEVPASQVSWTDDGQTVTFRFPRVHIQGKVELDFHADVLAPASSQGIDLPMTVDDSASPGAAMQQLWPGDADGIPGNGDDWVLGCVSTTPVAIILAPGSAQIRNHACVQLSVTGRDALGNSFELSPDSVAVRPRGAGTVGADLSFCAGASGAVKLIACYGALRDTSIIDVLPDQLAIIDSVTVRDVAAVPVSTLTPGDTMFVDVRVRDGDGLQDMQSIQFDVLHASSVGSPGVTAFGASFAWTRGGTPSWSVLQPTGTSWQVLPALCAFDESSNTSSPRTARLAFVVSTVARAALAGEWTVRARARSLTPPSAADTSLTGLNVPARLIMKTSDAQAGFGVGAPGTSRLPLADPPDAQVHFAILANTPFVIEGKASDLIGVKDPLDTLHVSATQNHLRWSNTSLIADGGALDTEWGPLVAGLPQDDDTPIAAYLHLWLDYPLTMSAQDYAGSLSIRAGASAYGATSAAGDITLNASVVNSGLAATLALAEVVPHTVTTGAHGQLITASLLPLPHAGDTGVDRVRLGIPLGYGAPTVTAVRVAGSPVGFSDLKIAGVADVALASKVTLGQLIEVDFTLDTPTDLDADGASFVTAYDDQSTTTAAQTAAEGDANGISDGNNWRVKVVAGALAEMVVTPATVSVVQGADTTFQATGADAFGHSVAVSPTWRVEGGIGSIGASNGSFTATTTGVGRVIAEMGGVSDTAIVTVIAPPGLAVRSVSGAATAVQGQTGVAFSVRVENTSNVAVAVDTLRLSFDRTSAGDADGDFTITTSPLTPVSLPAGGTRSFGFAANLGIDALAAPVSVSALVSGLESGSGSRLRDATADTALILSVLPGGLTISASQLATTVRPDAPDVVVMTLSAANAYPYALTLERITLKNTTTGPGDREQKDGELGAVSLYHDDGDGTFETTQDTLVMQTVAFNGDLVFSPADAWLAPRATTKLFVVADLPLSQRDGDVLDVELASAADVVIQPTPLYRNSWPAGASGGLTVDGMVAAQLAVAPVGPGSLNPGARDRLAFSAMLPANGYVADVLTRLSMGNAGTARPEDDIQRLRAWIDDGDGSFSTATDHLLGTLAYTGGGRWQLTGLSQAIPAEGARLFVSVDVTATAAQNATIKLYLPSSPDPGVGMASGDSGPLDAAVTNPSQLTLSDADRIAFGATPLAGGTARPGARQLPILGFTATNTYTVPRTLTTLVFLNTTAGPGTQAERDGEAKLLSLRADGNGNGVLDDTGADPVLSTAFFQSGQATFAGLAVPLPAGGTRALFLTADLSTTGARDGDAVSARVDDANGVDFSEATAVAGLFPLDSGAHWLVDGLTAAQITNLGAPGATVGPGDGPILALDCVVPRNGYAADLLRGVRITNLGTASATDLSLVQLWRDGGDGVFTGSGDDVLLGPLTPTAGEWTSPLLSTPVAGGGSRLFVSVNISATPAETTTVRFAIPTGGIEYESTNDGPLDAAVENPEGLLLSTSPLLASMTVPRASTVGQAVTVSMVVRNNSAELVRNVSAPALDLSGSAPFTYVSGPTPAAFDVSPASTDTIRWTYLAGAVGDARFSAVAGGTGDPSGLPRNAPRATSNAHRVYLAAVNVELTPVQTMPIRVNRGQADVVPFSLTLVHPGGADASDVRVDRLRIRLEEENGAPIVPSSLLDGVEVNEGTNVYLSKTGVETSGSTVELPLATPVTVTGTQPATISLRLDIDPATTVPTFRVVFDDSTDLGAQDATSGAPVVVRLDGASYPLRSELASVVAEATEVDMASLGPDTVRTSPGQPAATLMRLRLTSPGITGISSNVRVTAMAVALTDSAGADLMLPGTVFGEVRLQSGSSTVARRVIASTDADSIVLAFAPPIELAANVPLDLTLVGDVVTGATFGRYGSRLLDSARVDARDINTRAHIPAKYATAVVRGNVLTIEGPADTMRARGYALLPAAVVIGEADLLALAATVRHPGGPGTARLRVDSLTVQLLDDLRRPVAPGGTIGRLELRWNGVDQAEITNLPASGDRVVVPLPGLLLEAGDTARVEIRIDIDAAAPAGFLELVVPLGEVHVRDANTGIAATLAAEPGTQLPLHSGLGRLTPPARDLAFGLTSLMPASLAGDTRPVPAARLTLRNTDAQGIGPIEVDHLVVRCADRLFATRPLGAAATRIEAWLNGVLWAQSAPLGLDSTTALLAAAQRLTIPPGATATIELRMVTRAGAVTPGVRLGLDRGDVGAVQPASALLAINVGPESGMTFPMWTQSGVLAEASLESSYANFPNPFAAGRQSTTVVYFMPSPGRVTLRVLTARGELVTTLLDGATRNAGMQQTDRWDGRNGRGDVVVNGVYVAELEIRFDGGTGKLLRRKLAVVR